MGVEVFVSVPPSEDIVEVDPRVSNLIATMEAVMLRMSPEDRAYMYDNSKLIAKRYRRDGRLRAGAMRRMVWRLRPYVPLLDVIDKGPEAIDELVSHSSNGRWNTFEAAATEVIAAFRIAATGDESALLALLDAAPEGRVAQQLVPAIRQVMLRHGMGIDGLVDDLIDEANTPELEPEPERVKLTVERVVEVANSFFGLSNHASDLTTDEWAEVLSRVAQIVAPTDPKYLLHLAAVITNGPETSDA